MLHFFHMDFPAIGIEGDQVVDAAPLSVAIERFGEVEIQRFDQLFATLMEHLQEAEIRQFEGQGAGPVAGHWAELSPHYAESKRKHYGDKPILERTGDLKEALTTTTGHALRHITDTEMAFGVFELPYASYLQRGTDRMVARPPLDLDDTFRREFADAVETFVRDAHAASGLDEYTEIVANDLAELAESDELLDTMYTEG